MDNPEIYKAKLKKETKTGRWGVVIVTEIGEIPLGDSEGKFRLETYDCKGDAQFTVDTLNHNFYQLEKRRSL